MVFMVVQRIIGALLLAVVLLWFVGSEERALHTPHSSVHDAPLERIDPALEGTRIAVHGPIAISARISDGQFVAPGDYVVVSREVLGYGPVTRQGPTPAHNQVVNAWAKRAAAGPVADAEVVAEPASIGAYQFDASLPEFEKLEEIKAPVDQPAAGHPGVFVPERGVFYLGEGSYERPSVGDYLVDVRVLRAGEVLTLIGRQCGATIVPAEQIDGDGAARLTASRRSLAEMVSEERAAAAPMLWSKRGFVALVVMVALCLVVFPRETPQALRTAAGRVVYLSLWYVFIAAFVISVNVGGATTFIGSGVAGLALFAWSMASIPSSPTILR